MAEGEKPKFELPWGTLLPVIAALAGVLAQFKPLVSTRPSVPSEKSIDVLADQDVDARLWQDPLAVAQKDKAALDAESLVSHRADERAKRHQIHALVTRVCETASSVKGEVLLLAVMLDSGPYLEQGESRLRARQAVLQGLSESDFVPADGEHIGFVTAPWPPVSESSTKDPGKGSLLIPWEECRHANVQEHGADRVFILWLPAANFNEQPLSRFASLVEQFIPPNPDKLQVRLIGPANSTGLQAMLSEVSEWPRPRDPRLDNLLDGLTIISPRATAAASALLPGASDDKGDAVAQLIEGAVDSHARGGLHFLRTIATDDRVISTLIEELNRRRVHVAPAREENTKDVPADHIVLLTDWDTPYGRALARTFEEKARDFLPAGSTSKIHIQAYRYFHGIDGRLPGDPKETQKDDSKETQKTPGNLEATEGLNQSDFLRRLALQLKDQNMNLRRTGGQGIRAIGLLGSDTFDKLMILRALRPEFPDAIFFTDNFDAHFERRDAWEDTHNLVIASPFGSKLPKEWQRRIAPFRDNLQTSTYVGTLVATGQMPEDVPRKMIEQQRIFEISRKGAFELTSHSPDGAEVSSNRGDPLWFYKWIRSKHVIRNLVRAALALLALTLWISMSIVDRSEPGGGTTGHRIRRVLASTAFCLTLGVPCIVLAVAAYSQSAAAAAEPLAFLAGISIWPSEMLRLIALLLAIHFMLKAGIDLRANEVKINTDFHLQALPRGGTRWENFWLGLKRWQHVEWLKSEKPVTAEKAWHAYLRRNLFGPRFVRITALFIIYYIFAYSLMKLFGVILPPARGESAFTFDWWVLRFSIVGSMLLTFYVVDALQLNSNFIRIFTHVFTEWDPNVDKSTQRIPPLEEKMLSQYHDMRFVAERTEVVARLIWYPLIVLTLMCVARSSLFDNWTWPISLLTIFALNAAWALGSAFFLRRSAEQLRRSAIKALQGLRAENFEQKFRREAFDELLEEIRELKRGAFAPLNEQPFIRAVLFPSGGLGLLAVAQRFLDIF